jgi:hypothetical protein
MLTSPWARLARDPSADLVMSLIPKESWGCIADRTKVRDGFPPPRGEHSADDAHGLYRGSPPCAAQLAAKLDFAIVPKRQAPMTMRLSPHRRADSTSNCACPGANNSARGTGNEKAASASKAGASQCRASADRQRDNNSEYHPQHLTFLERRTISSNF